jgi:serine phosphatase RsbU (regulator of sigma subunit)
MKKRRNIFKIATQFILALSAFSLILLILPDLHPLPKTSFQITKSEAEKLASDFIMDEIPAQELKTKSKFNITQEFLENQSSAKDIALSLGFQPYQYWETELYSPEMKSLDLFLGSDQSESAERFTQEWYRVRFSPEGKLLMLDFETPRLVVFRDSLKKWSEIQVDPEEEKQNASSKAFMFLEQIGVDSTALYSELREVKLDSLVKIFHFAFTQELIEYKIEHQIKITASGLILYYELQIQPGLSLEENDTGIISIVFMVIGAVIYVSLIIIIIFFLIYFARKESISFKISMPFVYLAALLILSQSLFDLWHTSFELILLTVIVVPLFYGAGMLFLFAVSDSMARQRWSDKLVGTDLIRLGSFFNSTNSKSILRGVLLGILALAGHAIIMFIYFDFFNGDLDPSEGLEYSFTVIFPVLAIALGLFNKAIFHEFFFRLLGISFIRRFFNEKLTLFIGTILLTFVFSAELDARNVLVQYASHLIPTFLFVLFFIRYEILTTIIGYFTFYILEKAVIFHATSEPFFADMGLGCYFSLAILLIFALVTLYFKRHEQEKIPKYIPEYMRTMQERERLLREIEIARSVQLRFLPAYTPKIPNFEIAAFCQPAWEVGGDYFDYFRIDDFRWGITIGDVSNKGVSAAFYMTMVKGFLKALAIHHEKPMDILSETNTLFYENVERGHFISMIFGILDSKKSEFTFSRAGHNPLLLLVGEAADGQWLTPEGIAIGMAPADKFRSSIGEQVLQIKMGDTLVLYTDGYPEAMDESSEEFGEENLEKLIKDNIGRPAQEIIQTLETKITEWEGNQTAMDDRTIIVIKRIS